MNASINPSSVSHRAFLAIFIALSLCVEARSKPLPTYFRYESLASGALTDLVVGDFDGDGDLDVAGLTPSRRALVLISAKGKIAFRPHQTIRLPSGVQSLFAVNLAGETRANLLTLVSQPARAQLWRIDGGRNFFAKKRAELSLPDGAERLYMAAHRPSSKFHFFARAETGTLSTFSFSEKDGFSTITPLSLSHRVSDVILPARSTTDFFTQVVGENALWFHRPPPTPPLAIRCKESISMAATDDFNKNGLLDLVIVQALASGKTIVEAMFDVGVETGVAPIRFETPLVPKRSFIQDFNGDGLLDIGLSDDASFAIHLASSSTSFSESVIVAFSDIASGIAVADLNRDAKPELIVSERTTGKLIVYSTSHYERLDAERIATSGEPERLAFNPARKRLWVGCNRHKRLEQLRVDRLPSFLGSFAVAGKPASLWQDDFEMVCLATSPAALARKAHKSESLVSHRLFSLGVSSALFWDAQDNQPAIVAVLEERAAGAVPQLLFYALHRDSALSISEIALDAPISAENLMSISGATLKRKRYLVVLKSEKNARAIVVYELSAEKTRLRLVETERHALPKQFASQGAMRLLAKANKNQTMDFLVASSNRAVTLLSERLYQPQQISNFPKISDADVVLWHDGNGDDIADLIVSRHRRADVLFLRGRSRGGFNPPKVVLDDVIAAEIALASIKKHSTLFVANAKLHTIDILRLKK